MTVSKTPDSMRSSRLVYEIRDLDHHGILVDVLGELLRQVPAADHLRWAVFDLDWLQLPNGLLDAQRVINRSQARPKGLQLDQHGIRLFHAQSVQVVEGTFFAAPEYIEWPSTSGFSAVMRQSTIALRAFDSTYWTLSCTDAAIAQTFTARFANCCIRSSPC